MKSVFSIKQLTIIDHDEHTTAWLGERFNALR